MEIEEKLYEDISKITGTNYEGLLDPDKEEYLVTHEKIISMLEDLEFHVRALQKLIEQKEQYYHDNYRRISPAEMYGVSDNDFI